MTNKTRTLLENNGVAVLPRLYERENLLQWNLLLEPILNTQNSLRKYVPPNKLNELGIIKQLFTNELINLIFSLIPDAELYHCHVYETAANQNKPHIHSNNKLEGWHRDTDCKYNTKKEKIQHISLFIYLSDVIEESGAFELSPIPLKLIQGSFNRHKTYPIFGELGHCFLFDRKAFHRARPNIGKLPRRVLKISFQSRAIFNHKIYEEKFKQTRSQLNKEDIALRHLFGDKLISTEELTKWLQHKNNNISHIKVNLPASTDKLNFTLNQCLLAIWRDFKYVCKRLIVSWLKTPENNKPEPRY